MSSAAPLARGRYPEVGSRWWVHDDNEARLARVMRVEPAHVLVAYVAEPGHGGGCRTGWVPAAWWTQPMGSVGRVDPPGAATDASHAPSACDRPVRELDVPGVGQFYVRAYDDQGCWDVTRVGDGHWLGLIEDTGATTSHCTDECGCVVFEVNHVLRQAAALVLPVPCG